MDADKASNRSKPVPPAKPITAPKPSGWKSNSMKDSSRLATGIGLAGSVPPGTLRSSPRPEEMQPMRAPTPPPLPNNFPVPNLAKAAEPSAYEWPQTEKTEASAPSAAKLGAATPLQNFVETKEFPLQGDIETGQYTTIRETSLLSKRLTFHFRMRRQVVSASFDCGGTYQIPLCSANRFSLLYNPTDNFAQAMQGWYFETVSQIVSHSDPPAAVYVTKSYIGPNTESSVQVGDVLFISPRIKSKAFRRGKFLKCIKAGSNEKKILHESCPGGFNTSPHKLQLSLYDLTSCRYCDLPLSVVMFHDIPGLHNYPQLKLLKKHWEETVVVTNNSLSESPSKHSKVRAISIVKEMALSVVPVKLEKTEYSNLCQETSAFFDNFSLDQVEHHLFTEDPMWPQFETIQASLFKNTKADLWSQTHQIVRPEKAFRLHKRQKSLTDLRFPQMDQEMTNNPMYSSKSTGDFAAGESQNQSRPTFQQQQPNPIPIGELEQETPYVPVMYTGGNAFVTPIRQDEITDMSEGIGQVLHEVNTANRQLLIQLETVKGESEATQSDIQQMKKRIHQNGNKIKVLTDVVNQLQIDMAQLKENMDLYVSMTPAKTVEANVEQENCMILSGFTEDQVQQALDKLNLSAYKRAFARNQISGELLMLCSEEVLEKELGVTSKLHRMKIMALIQGRLTVWKYLDGTYQASQS